MINSTNKVIRHTSNTRNYNGYILWSIRAFLWAFGRIINGFILESWSNSRKTLSSGRHECIYCHWSCTSNSRFIFRTLCSSVNTHISPFVLFKEKRIRWLSCWVWQFSKIVLLWMRDYQICKLAKAEIPNEINNLSSMSKDFAAYLLTRVPPFSNRIPSISNTHLDQCIAF